MVSVEAFVDVVLNRMKVPTLIKIDVVFLAKKYIMTLPSHLQYEQLLEDFTLLSKAGALGSVANFKLICSYIRKACLAHYNVVEPD